MLDERKGARTCTPEAMFDTEPEAGLDAEPRRSRPKLESEKHARKPLRGKRLRKRPNLRANASMRCKAVEDA